MNIWNIVKTIWFIVLMGLFFGYAISASIFEKMQNYILSFNTNFFAKLPIEVVWLFAFLIFILVFAFILSFFRD